MVRKKEIPMLAGELLFYKEGKVIKTIDDWEFSDFNPEQLLSFSKNIANEIGATKVVSSCIYHGGANGSINTVIYLKE